MRDVWANWRRGHGPRWLAAGLLLLVIVLVHWRTSISQRLLPDPRMNHQLELADAAFARGDLTRADGLGARELYQSVLAIDPDQMAAQVGLQQVRDAAVARASQSLVQHHAVQARQYLALAQALSAPAVQLQPLQAQLHDLDLSATQTIPQLWAAATRAGVSDETALALYEKILGLDADNAIALEARRTLLAAWLSHSQLLINQGKIKQAQELVDSVIAHDPAHLDLPPVLAMLGEAKAKQEREQTRRLAQAPLDKSTGQISVDEKQLMRVQQQPTLAAAQACFDQALTDSHLELAQSCLEARMALDPDSAVVGSARHRLAERWLAFAEERIAASDFAAARHALLNARRWQPELAGLAVTSRRLRQAEGLQH